MARITRKTKRYPSDMTDKEWEQIAPLMPAPGRRGRPREVEFREVINAVRYLGVTTRKCTLRTLRVNPTRTLRLFC